MEDPRDMPTTADYAYSAAMDARRDAMAARALAEKNKADEEELARLREIERRLRAGLKSCNDQLRGMPPYDPEYSILINVEAVIKAALGELE